MVGLIRKVFGKDKKGNLDHMKTLGYELAAHSGDPA
jgi:hypothetical protein